MKLVAVLGASLWLSLSGTSGAFTCNGNSKKAFFSSTRLHTTNTLDGKELSGDFVPLNNMLLVKKSEVVDQTEGGIFLTGKVRTLHVHNTVGGQVSSTASLTIFTSSNPSSHIHSSTLFHKPSLLFNCNSHLLLSHYLVSKQNEWMNGFNGNNSIQNETSLLSRFFFFSII
jgi:hypothetical protein